MTFSQTLAIWKLVADALRSGGTRGNCLRYAKHTLPHPREAGAQVSIGLPIGQLADYRFGLASPCSGLHVQEFADGWVARLDETHGQWSTEGSQVACPPVPEVCLGGALAGAAVGIALGRNTDAMLAGAGIGILIALLLQESTSQ